MTEPIRIPFVRPYFPKAAMSADNLEFWVGREPEVDRVVRGLLASPDAHFLVTGYPGVGKTSFVSRVISEWRKLCLQRGISRVLIFNLQFAQSELPEQVVRRLIGSVFFGSLDGQFSPNKQLAERLQLSFIQAHSKMLKETQDETTAKEKGGEANVEFPAVASIFGAGLKFGLKRSKESRRSLEVEREYNLSAAIGDFEAVIHLLTKPESQRTKKFWPFWPFVTYETTLREQRILFVFDQIDDLDSVQALSPLFNLPRSSFIVLGGIKLKEQIALAKERGQHVLDSFQEEYLRCQWNESEKILSLLVSEEDIGSRRFAEYRDYLNFCAQGLPRRLFAAIDQHTNLVNDTFYLRLTESDILRARLGSKLHRVIWKNRKRILGDYIDNVQYFLRDKALRGTYHLADRMFRVAQFSFNDADTVVTQMSDAIAHSERKRVLKNLLATCVDEGLILNNGSNYSLSEEVLRWVRKIPDWLKDGFVDARSFLTDLTKMEELDPESTGIVEVRERHPAVKPKRDITPFEPHEDLAPEGISKELSRYRILRKVGSGGMGEVYMAEDKMLRRRVALKIIHGNIGRSSEARARFLREGQVVAHLQHPNIVQIYDVQELQSGQIVLVTEYVEGIGLENRISKQKLSMEETLSISIETAKALEEAHNQGVVHRDVKPSNILLTSTGGVKLVDFGIAKLSVREPDPDEDTFLTQTGALIGTASYMAPEQFMGNNVDARTDLYSLGVVIYQMLTGRRQFEAEGSMIELAVKVLQERPQPPSTHNSQVPPELDRAVMKCLERKPENRFSSAAELIETLGNVRKSLNPRP